MRKRYLILFSILVVASFLRLYRLDKLPPSLEWDEVATGFDAYSILKTGQDQFGNFLPLTFRSLDDYKPPLYTYLATVSIAVLGWNDFAVRFPAALLGILAVFTTFGMVQALLNNHKVSLVAALFLAVSPWHTNFSRLALETNSTIFFTTAGVWAFYIGLRQGRYLILTALLFGLNLYLYHNARVFIPLLGLTLVILHGKDLWRLKKYTLISAIICGIFVVRLIPIIFSIDGQMRFRGTSIFTEAVPLDLYQEKEQLVQWKEFDREQNITIFGRIFHSEKVFYAQKILRNYLSHFDPTFWVFTADSPRHHATGVGLLYLIDLPFIFAGTYFLLKNRTPGAAIIILTWMLLTPIPASVTRDTPHALRTAIFLPTFQILIALGLIGIYQKLISYKTKAVYLSFTLLAYTVSIAFFLHQYFNHYSSDTSQYWLYGRKEAAQFAENIKGNYDKIIVSTKLEHPHIFFLYYLRYDPQRYLDQGGTVSGGWAENRNKFDKYEFRQFGSQEMKNNRLLFIGLPQEFSPDQAVLKKIYYLNGKEAIWIVEG